MAVYPSQDWCDEWKKAINADESVEKTGKTWGEEFNGNWLFVINPGAGLKQTTYVYLEAAAGKCLDARIVEGSSEVDPGFIVTGWYPDYKSVVKGEADFLAGVVKGTFKIKGDMGKMVRYAKFIRAVSNTISSFESDYL